MGYGGYPMGPPQGYGMGASGQGYGAPSQGYGAPSQGYGAPPQGYGAPPQGTLHCVHDAHVCSTNESLCLL